MNARRCPHTARIDETTSLQVLSTEVHTHAQSCESCAHELERRRAFESLTARARQALAEAPDLEPAAWARVRAAVDAVAGRSEQPAWRTWIFGLTAVAAGAAVLFWVTRAPEPALEADRSADAALGVQRDQAEAKGPAGAVGTERKPAEPGTSEAGPLELAQAPAEALLEVATAQGDVALTVGPGAMIVATTEGERYRLLGRHDLELAQGTRLRVRALDAGGVELDLIEGLASFDVNRAAGERLFRVHVDDVLVEVRGTFWSVERRPTGVYVSVERGRVAVMREGEDEVLVEAGERVVFPRLDLPVDSDPEAKVGEPAKREGPRANRPKPERMVEVEVGHQKARSPEPVGDVEHLIPPILGAVRAGRCVQALSALDHVSRAVQGRMPRSGLWLTAYCQRKLGNLESSRKLFTRYGAGPWPVPVGDELPALP